MKNSTTQILKQNTKRLKSMSCHKDSYDQPLNYSLMNVYDNDNQYTTSYDKMTCNNNNNEHNTNNTNHHSYNEYIPHYAGFIPGMKSQHPIGASFCFLAAQQRNTFETRFDPDSALALHKSVSFTPISKAIGSWYDPKRKIQSYQSKYNGIDYNTNLRESGFSLNVCSRPAASVIMNGLGGNRESTEYRKQYNVLKPFQYTKPTYNTGILKTKNDNPNLI